MHQNKVNHIHPAEQAVDDGPTDRVPVAVADHHGKRTAEGDAAGDSFADNRLALFSHELLLSFSQGYRAGPLRRDEFFEKSFLSL